MIKKIIFAEILVLFLSLNSCTFWQAATVTTEILQNYPTDNPLETKIEDLIEDEFDTSVDISFWDDDHDKDWSGNIICECESH